jgi:hypothetical protein
MRFTIFIPPTTYKPNTKASYSKALFVESVSNCNLKENGNNLLEGEIKSILAPEPS